MDEINRPCCGRGYHVYTARMRLLGHAVEEAIMFIQLWMRFLDHAVDEITRPCYG